MSEITTIALLGGPESGKTTYLGALIRAIESRELSRIERRHLPDDSFAYERLQEPLFDGQYPQRTKAERHTLDLPLRAQLGSRIEDVSLSIGDYDGEEVERLFQSRTIGYSKEWRARSNARGILLFIRPDALLPLPTLFPPPSLTDRDRMRALGGQTPVNSGAKPQRRSPNDPESAFEPGIKLEETAPRIVATHERVEAPTVLAVIELLQFLRHERGLEPGERPAKGDMRITLLCSAWDALDPAWQRKGPEAFFREHAPILEDFLRSNYHRDDVIHLGLSSTAGDLRNSGYKNQYMDDPHGFVVFADASGCIHQTKNVALPIEWALFGDDALQGEGVEMVQR